MFVWLMSGNCERCAKGAAHRPYVRENRRRPDQSIVGERTRKKMERIEAEADDAEQMHGGTIFVKVV